MPWDVARSMPASTSSAAARPDVRDCRSDFDDRLERFRLDRAPRGQTCPLPGRGYSTDGGSEADRFGLLARSGRVRSLEPASPRRESRRIEHRREGQRHTIGRTLKNVLKPHRRQQWVIPPEANAGFVAAMEDVLETYPNVRSLGVVFMILCEVL